jgi:hypothetical protein
MATTTKYWVAGILVEAVKSAGGGFYEVTDPTGRKYRFIAEVFETVATPYTGPEIDTTRVPE